MNSFKSISRTLLALSVFTATPLFAETATSQPSTQQEPLNISGTLEVEGYGERVSGKTTSEFVLATFETRLERQLSKQVFAHAALLFEEDGDNELLVDEAFITYKALNSPWYVKAGRFTQPFGWFESGMISDPLTLELGETKHHAALLLGTESEQLSASFGMFRGDVQYDNTTSIDSFVAAVATNFTLAKEMLGTLGASFTNNMGDTDGLQDLFDDGAGNLVGTEKVSGYSFYGSLAQGALTLRAEYVAAANSFVDGTLAGLKPSASNVEVSYAVREGVDVTARYGSGSDMDIANQYGAALACTVDGAATLGVEYLHNSMDGAADADRVTVQLAVEF